MAVEETRRRLIETAERLFAEHGFDGVTLKQITAEAGQRNASALQYHFGSKVDLVAAIVQRRMPSINERRNAMLDALEREGRSADLRALLEAMIVPLAEQLGEPGHRRYYIGFLAQVYWNPRSGIAGTFRGKLDSGVRRANKLARAILGDLPGPVVDQRMALLPWQVVHALADFERFALARGFGRVSLFVSSLIDSLAGALVAPVSSVTQRELADAEADRAGAREVAPTDAIPNGE